MTAVGLGQHGFETVGPWLESLSCQIFSQFRIVAPFPSTPLIQKFFDTRHFLKHKGSPTKFFGTARQQIFDGKS